MLMCSLGAPRRQASSEPRAIQLQGSRRAEALQAVVAGTHTTTQGRSRPTITPDACLPLPSPRAPQILSYHVIPDQALTAAQLTDGQELTTLDPKDPLTARQAAGWPCAEHD